MEIQGQIGVRTGRGGVASPSLAYGSLWPRFPVGATVLSEKRLLLPGRPLERTTVPPGEERRLSGAPGPAAGAVSAGARPPAAHPGHLAPPLRAAAPPPASSGPPITVPRAADAGGRGRRAPEAAPAGSPARPAAPPPGENGDGGGVSRLGAARDRVRRWEFSKVLK